MTTIRHSVETLVVMAVLLAGWPVSAAGQAVAVSSNNDPVMTLSISDLSPAEKEVIAADASWAQAHQSCDMELMDQVLHDDPMFIHAHARVDTKLLVMKQFGRCSNEETIISPLRVVAISPNTAVVEAGMRLRQKRQTEAYQSLYTRVYVREGGDW